MKLTFEKEIIPKKSKIKINKICINLIRERKEKKRKEKKKVSLTLQVLSVLSKSNTPTYLLPMLWSMLVILLISRLSSSSEAGPLSPSR